VFFNYVESEPQCTATLPSNGVAHEGQFFTIDCVLDYQGNIVPTMTWSGPPPFEATYSPPSPSRVWARVAFIADRTMYGRIFECVTYFSSLGDQPEDMATNLPTFESRYRSLLFVHWGARIVFIEPPMEEYKVGDIMTCLADGFPNPWYQFQNLRTNEVFDEQTFTITEDLRGYVTQMHCRAQNIIQGLPYEDNLFFFLSVQ